MIAEAMQFRKRNPRVEFGRDRRGPWARVDAKVFRSLGTLARFLSKEYGASTAETEDLVDGQLDRGADLPRFQPWSQSVNFPGPRLQLVDRVTRE